MKHYTREVLNRETGELEEISLGNWVTIAELGEMYGLGRRQTTEVLRHLDVLQVETGDRTVRHRLAPWFVERGYGKRLKRKTDKYPFDVVSPEGQDWINDLWPLAVEELEQQRTTIPVADAHSALDAFSRERDPMTVQMQVCWLADHFPSLTQHQIGLVLSVSQQLVSRNFAIRAEQLARAKVLKTAPLREIKSDRHVLLDVFHDGCDHDGDRHIHKSTTRRKMTETGDGVSSLTEGTLVAA